MFSSALLASAEKLLADARAKGLKIVTAESCTGGLIAGLLTEIPGSSDVVERGFVTYSNESKEELLELPHDLIMRHGAVSAEVAAAMALGVLKHARADLSVAVTGVAGPGGGTKDKPVGLVHLAAARRSIGQVEQSEAVRTCDQNNLQIMARECRFGDIGRREVRLKSVEIALEMLAALL